MTQIVNAQVVKGMVKDKNDLPLSNSSVYINGKLDQGYIITSYDGRFEIKAQRSDTLVVSCIGFNTKKVIIKDNTTQLIITLEDELKTVEVVTALGLKRTEQELGYAIQTIETDELRAAKTNNFLHSVSGRSPGLNIKSSSAGPTASASIIIRGESSLSGSNQPLFVVNGMPITNDLFSSGDGLNGSSTIDFGNAAQILGLDDIEYISVLRGSSSAILYGSRAANGVILITTRNAPKKNGWSARFNSTTTLETILKLPNFQNEYGFGGYGKYSYNGGTTYTGSYYDAFGENWGPKLNGTLAKQWDSNGEAVPLTSTPDNIKDFYRPGITTINNISASHRADASDFRLSFSSLYKEGIVPNSNLHRHTMLAGFGQKISKRINFRANALYSLSGSDNVPNAGYDESSSIAYGWLWFPRNADINSLKNYWKSGKENIEQRYVEELWVNNPWMLVNENTNSFLSHRFIADAIVNINILPSLRARVRGSADVRNEARYFQRAFSTRGAPFGSYRRDDIKFTELNIEGLLSYLLEPENKVIKFTATALGNIMRQSSEMLRVNAPQLNISGVYNLGNSKTNILTDEAYSRKGINSLFAITTFSYKTMMHIETAGRYDAFSTVNNTSFLNNYYFSGTLSLILTEMFKLPSNSPLNFAKMRIAYGTVGSDTDPYRTRNFYDYNNSWGEYPIANQNPNLNNPDLRLERTATFEAGVDLRFFKSRLTLDATYYNKQSRNLIMAIPTPISSGYSSQLVNGGQIQNQGFELYLHTELIQKQSFSWSIDANIYHNRNKVIALPNGLSSYQIVPDLFPNDGGSNLSLEAHVGKPYGQLVGLGFQKDDDGNIIHENGLPLMTTEKVSAGTYQPDVVLGITQKFRYRNFSFSFLWDGQIGGEIYSRTHALLNTGGTITNEDDYRLNMSTLDGRVEYDVSYDAAGNPTHTLVNEGGVVGSGVMRDADGNLVANTVKVPTRDYFYAYYGNGFNRDNIEAATYSGSYVKLRELSLTYRLPSRLLEKVSIRKASITLLGRNLFSISRTPSIDAEAYSIRGNRIIHGFESGQLPSTRSFSINLNIEF
ncbi:MAG: SusC/RagA family TonB-linked outer membrane protein [Aureispira sp.]|nr:SusC/RagA family TonB-linked outer membrane protein [Aureispira sp.]